MSPHLRNLLGEAADDGGRPVRLDLAAVRAAGRRATWRHRALAGGGGLAAAAVITSIALVVAPGGSAPLGPSTDPSATPSFGDPGADALADALAPLFDVLTDRGYEVEVEGSIGGGSVAAEGTDEEAISASATVLTVTKDGATGAAVVAEFTDRAALALVGKDYPVAELCAVVPGLAEDFVWDVCFAQPDSNFNPDGHRYYLAAGGDGVDEALGVTLVRPDGTGISASLGEGPHDPERITRPTQPLDGLPLTQVELVEVLDLLDASAPLVPPEPLPPPTISPTPPPDQALPPPPSTGGPDDAAACPDEGIIATISDAIGSSRLAEVSGRTYICLGAFIPEAPVASTDVTDWTAPALDPAQLGLEYVNLCAKSAECNGELWYGAGVLPADVVRMTFEMPDGATVEAEVADRFWIFRHTMDAEDFQLLPPVIVRAYAVDGSVLLEGDVNAPHG